MDNSVDNKELEPTKNNKVKIISIILLGIGLILIIIGIITNLTTTNGSSKVNANEVSKSGITNIVISKEERYVDKELKESVTYNYNDKGIVESVKLKNDCRDYDHCSAMNYYAIGLYNYKYNMNEDYNIIGVEFYSYKGSSIYYDKDLNPILKYGYDVFGTEDKSVEVKYEYDKDGKLSKRIAYNNPRCAIDPISFGECNGSEEKTVNSTVTFTYNKGNLIEQRFSYLNGTTYINRYSYDEHNNVTKFSVEYDIKGEDSIIVDSDSYEGQANKGKLNIDYTYTYNKNLIKEINIDVNLNDKMTEKYTIKRKYDKNKNLTEEKVDRLEHHSTQMSSNIEENIYTRKIEYKQINYDKKNNDYLVKLNKIQTKTDSLADYLYKDDNWLSLYHFYFND